MITMEAPHQYGWICPQCHRVYSPWQSQCLYCGGMEVVTTQGNTTPPLTSIPMPNTEVVKDRMHITYATETV